MNEVPSTSGAALSALQHFVGETFGPEGFQQVLYRLPPQHVEPLRGIILPVRWYPTACYVAAIEAAHELDGHGNFYERYGRGAAEYEINVFQRFVLRFTSPRWMVERVGRMWPRFHTTGRWEIVGEGNHYRSSLRDFGVVHGGYCRVLTEWSRRAAQMTGSKGGDIKHIECRASGAGACVWDGHWI